MKTNDAYSFKKEKRHYVWTLAATLVALLLIVLYTFGSFYIIAREDALIIGEKSVAEQSEHLNNFLLQGLDVLQVTGLTIEYMLEHGSTSEEIEAFLLQESADHTKYIDENFTGIYGVFAGDYIDGIGWAPDDGFAPEERPWYQSAKAGNGIPVIVSPYVDAQTNTVMVSVSQMLSDGESVVSLDIVMDEMQDLAEHVQMDGKGHGFILDGKGLIVAHSDEKEKGRNYLADADMQGSKKQELAQQILSANGETIYAEIDGKDCVVFSEIVQKSWYVVMVVDTSDLFYKVQRTLVVNIVLSLFIFVMVAYFCTSSHRNRLKVTEYAKELKEYQLRLEERVEEQTKEIQDQTDKMIAMQENVIEGMATLIENRDGNTGEHVRSTKKYVSMIVDYMYSHSMHEDVVTEEFVSNVTSAAALHDVGKIGIADAILNKPGRFTPEEYEIMKAHASIGGDIVKDILGENANDALTQISYHIARYHHEKWDGSGYPDGLLGEQIPLSARIMAVADVFDALISKRVYKDKMSVDEAYIILEKDAGTHFDPEIVGIFQELRPQIEEYLR